MSFVRLQILSLSILKVFASSIVSFDHDSYVTRNPSMGSMNWQPSIIAATESVCASGSFNQGTMSFNSAKATVSRPSTTAVTISTTPPSSGDQSLTVLAPSSAMSQTSMTEADVNKTNGDSVSGKKGLSYSDIKLLGLFANSKATWAYNWVSDAGGSLPQGVEYVPMCWGNASASGCQDAVLSSGASYMLSFNEPDLSTQANLDPAYAARLHIEYIAKPLSGRVKIGSPAVSSMNVTGHGLSWLSSFLSSCNGSCAIDFAAIHWYGGADSFGEFQTYIQEAIDVAAQYRIFKLWITEFAANNGSLDAKVAFLEQSCQWLDAQPEVERYAYFMVGMTDGIGMVEGGTRNALGQAYDS